MRKIIDILKKYWFPIIVVIAIVVKHIITINLPMNLRDSVGADEYLMLYQAENLVKGNYLGPYDYLTLVKGIGFPVFLACAFKLGLSYLSLYSIYYSVACLVALIPIRRMVKNKVLLLVVFLGLLFCPATLDDNVQLVYRNMLIVPQSLFLLSSLMMMYFTLWEDKKRLFGWTVLASFSWIFMWHTREDSIWSLPLVVMTCVVILIAIISYKKNCGKIKQKVSRFLIIMLPFFILVLSIHGISYINYKYYGIYTTNQLNDSNYTKAVMLMMKVKPKKEIEHVEITRETLQRIYDVSPTFAELRDRIESDYEHKNGLVMAAEDNGEINEDLITWELTGAASERGYYKTAQTAEKFWGDVYDELKEAIDDGKLETRFTLPSRSLIPFPTKKGSFQKLISSIGTLYLSAVSYSFDYIIIPETVLDDELVRRYETITGGRSVRKTKKYFRTIGRVLSKDSQIKLQLGYEDKEGNLLQKIDFQDDMGTYDDLFDLTSNKDEIYFVVRDNNYNKLAYYNASNLNDKYISNQIRFIKNNVYIEYDSKDPMYNRMTRYVTIANGIRNAYSFGGIFFFFVSLVYYCYLTISLIMSLLKKSVKRFEQWLFLSAILGSVTVIIFGLGYVNAFMVQIDNYLVSCVGLMNLFIVLSIALLMCDMIELFKKCVLQRLLKSKNQNIKELTSIMVKWDMNRLFRKETNNTLIQFFRYLFVGGFAAIVNIGMLFVFTHFFKFYYLISNIISFVLGLIVNYVLSKKFVFQEETSISKTKEFLIYAIIGVIGLGLDTLFVWVFTDVTKIYYMVSKLLSTAVVFIWNFGARKVLYKVIK